MIVYCLLFLLAVAKCSVILGESRSGGYRLEDLSRLHDGHLSLGSFFKCGLHFLAFHLVVIESLIESAVILD
jgi:hypothetical protein